MHKAFRDGDGSEDDTRFCKLQNTGGINVKEIPLVTGHPRACRHTSRMKLTHNTSRVFGGREGLRFTRLTAV